MLGEILRTLPEYLKENLEQVGYNFNKYTAITSTETTMASTPITIIDSTEIIGETWKIPRIFVHFILKCF